MSHLTVNPYSTFDCLCVSEALSLHFESFSRSDAHLMVYLACLLSLYDGNPVSDWGYSFAGTMAGIPFSSEIQLSLDMLAMAGMLAVDNGRHSLTKSGTEELSALSSFRQNIQRRRFLDGATSALYSMPVGAVREALLNEPELGRARVLQSTRVLLDGAGIHLLYDQFGALSDAIGVRLDDLAVPALTWLSCLFDSAMEDTAVAQ